MPSHRPILYPLQQVWLWAQSPLLAFLDRSVAESVWMSRLKRHHIKEHTRCIWTAGDVICHASLFGDFTVVRTLVFNETAINLDSGRLSGTAPCVLGRADHLWLFWSPKIAGSMGRK
ncbi:hypothetical protein F5888DRAFT_1672028 [Russula emetica]|nr:hypothetical protein F5888DRAFT_1672028 [Russula emetica]